MCFLQPWNVCRFGYYPHVFEPFEDAFAAKGQPFPAFESKMSKFATEDATEDVDLNLHSWCLVGLRTTKDRLFTSNSCYIIDVTRTL